MSQTEKDKYHTFSLIYGNFKNRKKKAVGREIRFVVTGVGGWMKVVKSFKCQKKKSYGRDLGKLV